MADVAVGIAAFDGLFKHNYPDEEVRTLYPEFTFIQKEVGFDEATLLGKQYHVAIDLREEHALTHEAAGTTMTFNDVNAGQMRDAQIDGAQIGLRGSIDYEALFKAAAGGKQAFMAATASTVNRLTRSVAKDLEHQLIYGGAGPVPSAVANTSGTSKTYTFANDWSAAFWAGKEGAKMDAYSTADYTTQLNPTAVMIVSTIVLDSKTVLFTHNATDSAGLNVATLSFFVQGSTRAKEMAGIARILSNTTGTLFNISATTDSLWAGTYVTSAGQPSLGKILNWISKAVNKGLDMDVSAYMPTATFEVLNTDQAALRMFDSSYSSGKNENGTRSLTFYGQSGAIKCMPHPLVRDGDCFILAPKLWRRIGSTDLTFKRPIPGVGSSPIFRELNDKAAVEIRCYTQQAIFSWAPARGVFATGLTYA